MLKTELFSWLNLIVLVTAIVLIIWDGASPILNQITRIVIYIVAFIAFAILPWRGQKIITD